MHTYVVAFYDENGNCLASFDNVEAWSRFEAMADCKRDVILGRSIHYSWDADRIEEEKC